MNLKKVNKYIEKPYTDLFIGLLALTLVVITAFSICQFYIMKGELKALHVILDTYANQLKGLEAKQTSESVQTLNMSVSKAKLVELQDQVKEAGAQIDTIKKSVADLNVENHGTVDRQTLEKSGISKELSQKSKAWIVGSAVLLTICMIGYFWAGGDPQSLPPKGPQIFNEHLIAGDPEGTFNVVNEIIKNSRG